MVKEEKVFITTDGSQYKTKKYAERHENEGIVIAKGYTKKEVDGYVKELTETNRIVALMLKNKPDWRDWDSHLVGQLPDLIYKLKNDVVNYEIVVVSRWTPEPKVQLKETCPRLPEGAIPESFTEYLDKVTKDNKDGTTFKVEFYESVGTKIQYKLISEKLSPETKLEKGIPLREEDIQFLLRERTMVHEVEGESRRWSKGMTTVIKGEDGNLYAIDWDKGLTESQEDTFYDQPKRVELEEREVVTTVTAINYL